MHVMQLLYNRNPYMQAKNLQWHLRNGPTVSTYGAKDPCQQQAKQQPEALHAGKEPPAALEEGPW